MSLKIGNTNIVGAYKGSTPIIKGYVGNTLIFDFSSAGGLYEAAIQAAFGTAPDYRWTLDNDTTESIEPSNASSVTSAFTEGLLNSKPQALRSDFEAVNWWNNCSLWEVAPTRVTASFWVMGYGFNGVNNSQSLFGGGGTSVSWGVEVDWDGTNSTPAVFLTAHDIDQQAVQQPEYVGSGMDAIRDYKVHHIVAEWDFSALTLKLWVDKTLYSTTMTTITASYTPANAGKHIASHFSRRFASASTTGVDPHCVTSDVVVWENQSRGITQAEVDAIYDGGIAELKSSSSPRIVGVSPWAWHSISNLARAYYPTDVQLGDLLIIARYVDNEGTAVTTQDGWTELDAVSTATINGGFGCSHQVIYKIAEADEVTASINGDWNQTAWSQENGARLNGIMYVIRGVNQTTPIEGVDGGNAYVEDDTTYAGYSNPNSSTQANSVAVVMWIEDEDNFYTDLTLTGYELMAFHNSSRCNSGILMYDKPTAGADTGSFTKNNPTSKPTTVLSFYINT